MPPKTQSSKKLSKLPQSSWLSKFFRSQDIPGDIKDVLVEHQITSKQVFDSITEQDLADMGLNCQPKNHALASAFPTPTGR